VLGRVNEALVRAAEAASTARQLAFSAVRQRRENDTTATCATSAGVVNPGHVVWGAVMKSAGGALGTMYERAKEQVGRPLCLPHRVSHRLPHCPPSLCLAPPPSL
jgi:hypothetical protein